MGLRKVKPAEEDRSTIWLIRAIAEDVPPEVAAGSAAKILSMHLKTDNKGNAFSLQKEYARKWPCSAMLMEHTLWCHVTNVKPQVVHVILDTGLARAIFGFGQAFGGDVIEKTGHGAARWGNAAV